MDKDIIKFLKSKKCRCETTDELSVLTHHHHSPHFKLTLTKGDLAYDKDTNAYKIFNGVTFVNALQELTNHGDDYVPRKKTIKCWFDRWRWQTSIIQGGAK